jgi:hypothetical protein
VKLSIVSLAAVALVLVVPAAGCVSNTSPQTLANDPEGCTLKNYKQNGAWGRLTSRGSIAGNGARANCASNRAAEQQRTNQMINFGNEMPQN